MGVRIPYEQASEIAKKNAESRIGSRGDASNRIEPECWPALRPRFRFDKDTGIFVIGSCFATNIERYLGERGYRLLSVPELDGLGSGTLNKYTPASILEAVSWARAIYDRDDTMSAADAELCFFRLGDGRILDTQLHAVEPLAEDEALALRQGVYDTYRQLFSAELVIITLGLIEAWYDTIAERYIVETPNRWMIRAKGRFAFERLSYEQCLDDMRQALALIRGGAPAADGPRLLLTTSPVVLTRTFTPEDVIVANTYSKSVLRTVAGRLVEDDPAIDYFPSYESVMLTRNNAVWRDDLMHVSEPFVHQIMARVERAYTGVLDDTLAREIDMIGRVVNHVSAHEYEEANRLYAGIARPFDIASIEFHTFAAVLKLREGASAQARQHLAQPLIEGAAQTIGTLHAPLRIWVWAALGDPASAHATIDQMRAGGWLSFNRLWRAAVWLLTEDETAAAAELLALLDPTEVKREMAMRHVLKILESGGQTSVAQSFRTRWLSQDGEDLDLGLAEADAEDEAVNAAPSGRDPLSAETVRKRGMAMAERGEAERARRLARRFLREARESTEALLTAAVIEETLGEREAAMRLRAKAQRQLKRRLSVAER
ncbi:MAG: GSCFA domain-containing protein [Pseudomonadota bacterium]